LAYIGNKPANKAVVASDLDPAVITGQTALAVAPADTDEFLISDAGTLKRLDASLIKPGFTLLQTTTISDAATVTIGSSSIFSSTYKTYLIQGSNIHFASDGVQGRAYFQHSGSDVTSSYSRSRIRMKDDSATVSGDSNNANAGSIDNLFGYNVGNASGEAANFTAYLYDPASTDNYKFLYSMASYSENDGAPGFQQTVFSLASTNAVDGIKLFASSGNITSGTVKIYGLA
jgi:hypothetical protein